MRYGGFGGRTMSRSSGDGARTARDSAVQDIEATREWQRRIPGSTLIPLGEVPRRYQELDAAQEIITQCKSGQRSAKAADYLRTVGFKKVKNLKGGILAWIDQVDPSQPKY